MRKIVKKAIKPPWPEDMRNYAKEVYVAWTGDKRAAMRECERKMRIRFAHVPDTATLYRWADKYGWEEERQKLIKAAIVDAAAESLVKKADEVNPSELLDFLTNIVKDELDEGKVDNEGLRKIEKKIHEVAERPLRPRELADLAHALADTTRARGKRGNLAARVLQAFATALDALARREEKVADTRAICPALTGGPINSECPLLRHDHDDKDIPR